MSNDIIKEENKLHVLIQPYRLPVVARFNEPDNIFFIFDQEGYTNTTLEILKESNIKKYYLINDYDKFIKETINYLKNNNNIKYLFLCLINNEILPVLKYAKSIGINIYYIHHGLWNKTQLNVINNNNKIVMKYELVDHIIITNHEKSKLTNVSDKNKLVGFNGMLQLDYVINKKQFKLKPGKKKNLLFVNNYDQINLWGKNNSKNKDIINDYIYHISFLCDWCKNNNVNFYIKIKHNFRYIYDSMCRNTKIINIHKQSHVYLLDKENIYDYINADYILIQGYSTFYIESLLVNYNVIICQYMKICDSLETDQFNLLKSKNKEELKYILDNLNKLIDNKYILQIKKYINFFGLDDNLNIKKYILNHCLQIKN